MFGVNRCSGTAIRLSDVGGVVPLLSIAHSSHAKLPLARLLHGSLHVGHGHGDPPEPKATGAWEGRLRRRDSAEALDDEALVEREIGKVAQKMQEQKGGPGVPWVVALTGAGMSTESGIPDYRGGNEKRQIAPRMDRKTVPNSAHLALAALVRSGWVAHVVTMNIDELDIVAGTPDKQLTMLHGSAFVERCKRCNARIRRSFDVRSEPRGGGQKSGQCPECEGTEFAQTIVPTNGLVDSADWKEAENHMRWATAVLVLGTSLSVTWGSRKKGKLPLFEYSNPDVYMVLCNKGKVQDEFETVVQWDVGDFLTRLAQKLLQVQDVPKRLSAPGEDRVVRHGDDKSDDAASPPVRLPRDRKLPVTFLESAQWYLKCALAVYGKSAAEICKALGRNVPCTVKGVAEGSKFQPAYYVMVDDDWRQIVLAVRGTASFGDVVTDVDWSAVEFPMRGKRGTVDDFAHRGFLKSATWVVEQTKPILIEQKKRRPAYDVRVVGHSLGGAVATLVALLIQDDLKGAKAVTFGTPPCISETLVDESRDIVTAFLDRDDIVPRLSRANALQFANYMQKVVPRYFDALVRGSAGVAMKGGIELPMVLAGRLHCIYSWYFVLGLYMKEYRYTELPWAVPQVTPHLGKSYTAAFEELLKGAINP